MTNYNEAVAEARRLVKRSEQDQWRLAELTWEQVQAGKTRRQWALDVGVTEVTAQRWYRVWELKINNLEVSYSEAWNQIIGRVDGNYAVAEVRGLPSERKAEVARELLAEPEVAEQVADVIEEQVSDSPAATARVNQKAEAKRPAPSRHEPKRSAMSAAASLTALEATAARLHDVVTDVVADVMDGQADPKLLAEPINSIGVDLQRLKIAAESSSSIDDALVDLLNGDN